MTTPAAPTRKPSATAQAQAQAIERMEAIARRAEEAAHAIREATSRNEAALTAIIGLARLMDGVSRRLPPIEGTVTHHAPAPGPEPERPADDPSDMPRTGRQLYAWARKHNLIRAVEEIGQGRAYDRRIVEWTPAQVSTAYCDLFEAEQEGEDESREPEPEPVTEPAYARYGPTRETHRAHGEH